MHIADGVDVNQESDSRDDKQHDACERIDEIGQIDGEVASEDPSIGDDFMGHAGPQDIDEDADRAEKRQSHRSPSKPVREFVGIPRAQESV
jgi:hypothetical protein